MSSPNKDKNALEVLADTASDDELRNRYDASKHSVRSSSENRDHYSTSSETKEDDDSGGRGSADGDLNSSIAKAASKTKKDGLRKGKWMVSIIIVSSCYFLAPSVILIPPFSSTVRKRKKNTLQGSSITSVQALSHYLKEKHFELFLRTSCNVILCASQRSLQEHLV